MEQFDTLYTQCRHIEHMHEGVWFTKNYYGQNDSYENLGNLFRIILQRGYAGSIIVHTRADQLLSQLLIEHFDTLPTQTGQILVAKKKGLGANSMRVISLCDS